MSDEAKIQSDLLINIHQELVAIRALLSSRSTPATAPRSAATTASGNGEAVVIPQPSPVMDLTEAEDTQVHFGKNKDKALRELSERSVEWYATEQPPRLDSSGKPYPARPQEIKLRNAARTIYHTRAGTLQRVETPSHPSDEEVPF